MSLLSTFAILFETDAKKATDESEALADALEDVEDAAEGATGGTESATKSYNENAMSAGSLTRTLFGMLAAYVAIDAVAGGIIDNATQIDQLGKFSQTLGLNIVDMDAWGTAAARNGGSAEAFKGSVESLQTALQDMEITGGGEIANTLAMIGVQATGAGGKVKDVFSLLPEIADAFKGLSTQQSFAFGKKLGLDQGTILMLQQGSSEIGKLVERQKMLGGVTKEGYEQAALFNDQWDDTKRVFNSLWLSSNTTILPLLQKFLRGLESIAAWVKENQSLVEGFFVGVGAVITVAYLPAIISAAAATAVAIAPFVAIGAAIAAVGVAVAVMYEDIKAWVSGSKSAIGEVIGTFDDLKTKVDEVFGSIAKKWDELVSGGIDLTPEFVKNWLSDDTADNTAKGQTMIETYSNNQLNQGGYNASQSTQNVNVNVGGANIDARGMSLSQASRAFNDTIKQDIEMAMGQLSDGVAR